MASLLPHDLCHGQSSSRWPPANSISLSILRCGASVFWITLFHMPNWLFFPFLFYCVCFSFWLFFFGWLFETMNYHAPLNKHGKDSRLSIWDNVSQRTLAPHLKMLREIYLTQNSIPKKKTYQKQDKILSQTYNNYETASPPTDQCNKKWFLKGLKREISIILAISVLQKTLIKTNTKVVFLPTSRKCC